MQNPAKSRDRHRINPKLDMAPMIDVVFLLLIFFVATIVPEDIECKLEVDRPSPVKTDNPELPPPQQLRISITPQDYIIYGRARSIEYIDNALQRKARLSKDERIIITCYEQSLHSQLIKLLNVCEKAGMKRIAVMSL